MIDEIKKEIYNYKENADDILPLPLESWVNYHKVIEILDKYKNQETFLNERIDTLKNTQLKQLNIISKLEKYKNAWEELKEGIEINMDYYDSSKFKEFVSLNHIEELEQKHNLGGKE